MCSRSHGLSSTLLLTGGALRRIVLSGARSKGQPSSHRASSKQRPACTVSRALGPIRRHDWFAGMAHALRRLYLEKGSGKCTVNVISLVLGPIRDLILEPLAGGERRTEQYALSCHSGVYCAATLLLHSRESSASSPSVFSYVLLGY